MHKDPAYKSGDRACDNHHTIPAQRDPRLVRKKHLRYDIFNHSFVRYGLVGSVGFVIDAGMLALLHYGAGWGVMPARLTSFTMAVTATWLLNRLVTFRDLRSNRMFLEWIRYTVVNITGGGVNLAIFAGLVYMAKGVTAEPLIAIVISSMVAMSFTYSCNRWFVFTTDPR